MATVWRLITHHEDSATVAQQSQAAGRLWIGWGRIGDLSTLAPQSPQDIARAIRAEYPELNNSGAGGANLWSFLTEVEVGDLVILGTSQGRAGVMKVTGPYEWLPDDAPQAGGDYFHARRATLTGMNPDVLWRLAGEIAIGQNMRRTLIRCAKTVTASS